ncbi:hypothetical protein GW17_00029931 [Ensete ventricosum]|nr:hypothetical protein GW17_00029931 [Ensete ventricosum]
MEKSCNILVIWRGKQFNVNVNPDSNVKEFGQKLQELTNVRPDTMRLFVPQKNNKGSKMLSPFSNVHSMLSLRESAILESYDSYPCHLFHFYLCQLNPPPSEALRRMHMLACDPGIIAIMNKLNEEAASLDWTKSTSHTLSGHKYLDHYEEEDYVELSSKNSGQKLGGATNSLVSARASSIAAAYIRMAHASSNEHMPAKSKEPDPDDSQMMDNQGKFSEPDLDDMVTSENDVMLVDMVMDARRPFSTSSMLDMLDELDPDDSMDNKNMSEPDPDDSLDNKNISEPDPDDSLNNKDISEPDPDDSFNKNNESEPDPDDCLDSKNKSEPDPDDSSDIKNMSEPDPDDSHARGLIVSRREPDQDDTLGSEDIKLAKETDSAGARSNKVDRSSPRDSEPDPDDSLNNVLLDAQMEETHLGKHYGEPDLDHSVKDMVSGDHERLQQSAEGPPANEKSTTVDHVNDVDNQELQRIEEPAALFCSRLQRAIDVLQSEATPLQATSVLQTLFKIIRFLILNFL